MIQIHGSGFSAVHGQKTGSVSHCLSRPLPQRSDLLQTVACIRLPQSADVFFSIPQITLPFIFELRKRPMIQHSWIPRYPVGFQKSDQLPSPVFHRTSQQICMIHKCSGTPKSNRFHFRKSHSSSFTLISLHKQTTTILCSLFHNVHQEALSFI